MCAVSEERQSLLENGTDTQDRCRVNNKCLVFGESLSDTIILEHYQFVPDISISRSPRIVYLVQIIRKPHQVMDTYVPHLPLPGKYDG
ncbi:hypothetical protein Holit_03293 [Hollandina sp. SP2]